MSGISPAVSRFRKLPSEAEIQLYCGISDYDRTAVLALSKQAVEAMAAIGARLDISYYDLTDYTE
jgi:hypothetical protein